MKSHLLTAFMTTAWFLQGDVYDRLSGLLDAHLRGDKDVWRAQGVAPLAFLDAADDGDGADDESAADSLVDGIAVIDVRGVLAMHADQVNGACMPQGRSYDSIISQLDAAVSDPAVCAIVLRLETPGGSAVGCQECYDAIVAASALKPVHAYVSGYCFSAGMYLACACDLITASSSSAQVGSIGVIMSAWDTSAANEKQGVKRVSVRSSPYKAPLQSGEPVTDATRAELQREVDAYAAAFTDAVRAGRGLDDAACAEVCNGRTFMASAAVSLDLIDHIAPFASFLTDLRASLAPLAESPMKFFTRRTSPANPAAAAAPAQESGMDPKLKAALTDLSAKHPTHAAALVHAAMQPNATAADLDAVVAKADLAAKDATIADLTAKVAQLSTQMADKDKAHAEALAKATATAAQAADVAKLAGESAKDPGAGTADASNAKPRSEIDAMTPRDQARFYAAGGTILAD